MRIHLEQLPHQEAAISRIMAAMEGCLSSEPANNTFEAYANPVLKRMRGIDVKMETGTGKTYVYTRLMHELYQRFGLNKFIIMTPSLPIKEGVKNFIKSGYATQHFRELFSTQKINLGVVNAGDFTTKKGKRKQFAAALLDFCEASRNDVGTVSALLLNDAMLGSKSMTRTDYDQTLIGGSSSPIEALKFTRPIVIIDEPHRFRKDSAAWANIIALDPQLIIRFGATFPDVTLGSGRNKLVRTDYDNLVYDLTAVESFNQGLVKGIDINFPSLPEDQAALQYRVDSATSKELVLRRDGSMYTVQVGEELSVADPLFEGNVTYEGKKLSNDLEVAPGMVLLPGVWGNSYQELMLRQAIDAHFEKERELFYRPANAPRVKTLSLYFIDSIASYRHPDGWLKKTFERLLNDKLSALIAQETGEYKAFLEATKASLNSGDQKVHAGYFAEDTGKKGDEAIQAEVDDILRKKETMLQFKDEAGNWNLRRFLFSKWTLREGWDNPNVFVVTKLRSSGSETSKIQEVGRGLRLPVDELGNRLSNEVFRLHFLIDYSERDFAEQLKNEINSDGGKLQNGRLTDELIGELIRTGYAATSDEVKDGLYRAGIINFSMEVLQPEELENLIPVGVKQGIIRVNPPGKPTVHLRTKNWEKISSLWAETSKRFMLRYDTLSATDLDALVADVLTPNVFSRSTGRVTQLRLEYDATSNAVALAEQTVTLDQEYGQMPYRIFLRRVHEATNLPINAVHAGLVRALRTAERPEVFFNDLTVHNISQAFTHTFIERFAQKYTYEPLNFTASVLVFNGNGQVVDALDQGVVGTKTATDVRVPDNYLYDEAVYDSDIEHQILKEVPPREVLVFGKLPRRSIKVPTFTGGTSSPDFLYAIRDPQSDSVKLHALIEAKGKGSADQSATEQAALRSQAALSKVLTGVDISLVTDARQVNDILRRLINTNSPQ